MMIDIITIGFIVTPMGFIPILILSLLKGIDENEGDIPNFLRFIAVWILIIIFVVGVIRMCEDSKFQDYTLEETCMEYETIQHREFADELIKKCMYYDCVDYLGFENREQWLELLYTRVPISIIECKSLCWDEKGFDEYMWCIKENIRNRLPQKAVFTWNETKCLKWEAKLIRTEAK